MRKYPKSVKFSLVTVSPVAILLSNRERWIDSDRTKNCRIKKVEKSNPNCTIMLRSGEFRPSQRVCLEQPTGEQVRLFGIVFNVDVKRNQRFLLKKFDENQNEIVENVSIFDRTSDRVEFRKSKRIFIEKFEKKFDGKIVENENFDFRWILQKIP